MAGPTRQTSDAASQDVARLIGTTAFGAAQIDWLIVLLPTALAVLTFRSSFAVLAVGMLTAVAIVRKASVKRSLQPGPLLLVVAAAVIVLSRADHLVTLVLFLIVALLAATLAATVDARTIIASLVDGAGVYLAVNVIGYLAGIRSPGAQDRVGGYVESSGLVRRIFPLAGSLEVAPSIAALYIGAAVFLLRNVGPLRRSYRLALGVPAFIVLLQSGARTATFAALAIPLLVALLPFVTRWLAPAMTVFASLAAFILPAIMIAVESIAIPLIAYIAPDRDMSSTTEITTLMGRQSIWRSSIEYWLNFVNGTAERLLGFGQTGQYKSGVSLAYYDLLIGTVQHPELASLHNSFLQQLFDGGLIGWLLLSLGIFWASVRLSRQRRRWGRRAWQSSWQSCPCS